MKALIVIAAGNASRMGYIPKAAAMINGKSNLVNTVEKAEKHFDKIIIYSNDKYQELYTKILEGYDKAEVIAIESGRGTGHAVMMALRVLPSIYQKDITMCWGDAYIKDEHTFTELLQKDIVESPMVFPVVREKDPYVWFSLDENGKATCAKFSKSGETTKSGLHDQSIFRFNPILVLGALEVMHTVLDRLGEYSNGEMRFLDVVHYFKNIRYACSLYETEYPTLAYNTETELEEINELLK